MSVEVQVTSKSHLAEPPGGRSRFKALCAFPTRLIADNPRIASWTAKAVWLLIPLQYYVLTNISLGFRGDAFTPTASVLLIAILAIFVAGSAIAILGAVKTTLTTAPGAGYAARARAWSTALLITWGASLALYAAALLLTMWLEAVNIVDWQGRDLVNYLLRIRWGLFREEKALLGLISVSLIYSVAAVLVVALLFGALRSARTLGLPKADRDKDEPRHIPAPDPNIFLVALINTALMTLLFSYIGGIGIFASAGPIAIFAQTTAATGL